VFSSEKYDAKSQRGRIGLSLAGCGALQGIAELNKTATACDNIGSGSSCTVVCNDGFKPDHSRIECTAGSFVPVPECMGMLTTL
jgi:hypothetical protein